MKQVTMKIKRSYYRKEKQCEIYRDLFKGGKSNSHFRRPCKGKGKKEVKTERCRNYDREILKSNFKRHRKACEKPNIKEKDTQILHLYTSGTMHEYMEIMKIRRRQIKDG